jgi:hypothetical protein
VPLPWATEEMVLAPLDLSLVKTKSSTLGYESAKNPVPSSRVAVCKRFIYFSARGRAKRYTQLKFNDGSIEEFCDGNLVVRLESSHLARL